MYTPLFYTICKYKYKQSYTYSKRILVSWWASSVFVWIDGWSFQSYVEFVACLHTRGRSRNKFGSRTFLRKSTLDLGVSDWNKPKKKIRIPKSRYPEEIFFHSLWSEMYRLYFVLARFWYDFVSITTSILQTCTFTSSIYNEQYDLYKFGNTCFPMSLSIVMYAKMMAKA